MNEYDLMLCILTSTSSSTWLDNVSKMLIVLHCVCLSMYKPYEERTSTLVVSVTPTLL